MIMFKIVRNVLLRTIFIIMLTALMLKSDAINVKVELSKLKLFQLFDFNKALSKKTIMIWSILSPVLSNIYNKAVS